jgi:hypothetical protein
MHITWTHDYITKFDKLWQIVLVLDSGFWCSAYEQRNGPPS